jgi:hypothetical protein
VRFLKPARGTVTARFELPEERVAEAREQTDGAQVRAGVQVEIVDAQGTSSPTSRRRCT